MKKLILMSVLVFGSGAFAAPLINRNDALDFDRAASAPTPISLCKNSISARVSHFTDNQKIIEQMVDACLKAVSDANVNQIDPATVAWDLQDVIATGTGIVGDANQFSNAFSKFIVKYSSKK